ncbi:hypothetical protein [Lysobacter gummosus]|uniref:hypothetical protein n=1 Tax=Lysobacter gummosus TaxID=262324 RepID=UPI003631DE2C
MISPHFSGMPSRLDRPSSRACVSHVRPSAIRLADTLLRIFRSASSFRSRLVSRSVS